MKKMVAKPNKVGPWRWLIPVCGVAVFALGYGAGVYQAGTRAVTTEQRLSGYQFISPLLDCEMFGSGEVAGVRALRDKLRRRVAEAKKTKQASHISIYFRDLNNGPWMGIDEDAHFSPASLLKVPVMVAYFDMVRRNPDLPFQAMTYDGSTTPFRQNVVPSQRLEVGRQYAAEELVRRMIVHSDNEAMQLVLNLLGEDKIRTTLQKLGVDESRLWKSESVTVKEYAGFFRVLYNASLLDRDMSEKALRWLSQVDYKEGLTRNLPGTVAVSHKFGERDFGGARQLHDCGIVYHPTRPYLMCVMTRGEDGTQLAPLIADLSRIVFGHFQNGYLTAKEAQGQVSPYFQLSPR
jgi:beta-lactamase class A